MLTKTKSTNLLLCKNNTQNWRQFPSTFRDEDFPVQSLNFNI